MPKTLTFYSNPEVGAVHAPDQAYIFIGARLDIEKSQASGKNIFVFTHDPVKVDIRDPHVSYYAALCKHGDLFAGDQETVAFCGGGEIADEFRMKAAAEAASALAEAKVAAKKQRDEEAKAASEKAIAVSREAQAARRKAFEEEVAAKRKAAAEKAEAEKAAAKAAKKPADVPPASDPKT